MTSHLHSSSPILLSCVHRYLGTKFSAVSFVYLTMGVEPPFLYDPPSRYSFTGPTERGFNPKAATQASRSPPRQTPRQEGPLINNINKHPDSYLIVPYGNINVKPMSPRTKKRVKYTRYLQLFLRICTLLGAVGMLVCVICIKGTQDTVGWIIRIPVSMTQRTMLT